MSDETNKEHTFREYWDAAVLLGEVKPMTEAYDAAQQAFDWGQIEKGKKIPISRGVLEEWAVAAEEYSAHNLAMDIYCVLEEEPV